MFRIGEFSRIARVTIDTLRHYDALGLIKPAKVDPFTGYRFYTARQLIPLNRIRVLKELGFSLEEVGRILQDELSMEELRGMLKAQLTRADSELHSARMRRERLLARLKFLSLEENMPVYDVTLKSVAPHTVAAIREVVPTIEEVPQRCNHMFDTIAQWMGRNDLPFGPPLTLYYNESYTRENIDTECAFIIPDLELGDGLIPPEPIVLRQLEAIPQAATTLVSDDFHNQIDGLTPAYNAIARWIEDNGYRIIGPPRELFYGSPDGGDLAAEIQFPVEKA